jgi:tRNA-splicing ligase RtcB
MDIVTGKILKLNNWPDGKVIGVASGLRQNSGAGCGREVVFARLDEVRNAPEQFLADPRMGECPRMHPPEPTPVTKAWTSCVRRAGIPHLGREPSTRLRCADGQRHAFARDGGGALMPDAHMGYGLPIGGVLAADNAVIPYAWGWISPADAPFGVRSIAYLLGQKKAAFENALLGQTAFGMGAEWQGRQRAEHECGMTPPGRTRLLMSLQDKAARQLGTSGSGNHFVEWGAFSLYEPCWICRQAIYLALLSHSGSRSIGYKIADRYSKLAVEKQPAWIAACVTWPGCRWIRKRAGVLAVDGTGGRFASASHAVIHRRVAEAVGLVEAAVVENHHNFAWYQTLLDGRTVIVHRKGATPAGKGMLGVIPGSIGDAGYVVRGRGSERFARFASHGAGRQMSRKVALVRWQNRARCVSQGKRCHLAGGRAGRIAAGLQTDRTGHRGRERAGGGGGQIQPAHCAHGR